MLLKKTYDRICEVYLARIHQAQGLKELNVLNKGFLFNNDLKIGDLINIIGNLLQIIYQVVNMNGHLKVLAKIDKYFSSITSNKIAHENLFKLKYCKAVIIEMKQLTPAINSITRYSTDTCEIADNHEVFNPDRFYYNTEINNDIIDIDDTVMSKNKFSYTIFGSGLCICPAITACQELNVIIKPRKKHPPYLSSHAVEPNGQHTLLSWQSSSQNPLPHLLEPLGQHMLPD
ncbi:hypothetical protein C2G38_2239797 [Gigaspora rosea]|uniref:Cytochrome P450 n=1 Tax=Gigaspora rosea TaxID=44941 RepID=A0A397W940_9GLOM|nr:hypothetical protein C2G38_2239797 [Gigaspora rosea]